MAAPNQRKGPSPPPPTSTVAGGGYTSGAFSGANVGGLRASADSTATETEIVRRFLPELHAVIEAKVGQMKAEISNDFDRKLDDVKTQLSHLPSTTTFITTIIGGLVGAVALLFAVLSWAGDRTDSSWERSGSLATTLSRIESKTDATANAVQELENEQNQPATSTSNRQN